MNRPTLRTIARLLGPWRTKRRLEAENQRLLGVMDARAQWARCARKRLHHCPTHGQQPLNAWGCPECVRELRAELAEAEQESKSLRAELAATKQEARNLRAELATAKQDAEYLRGDLATAREAVRRLVRWGLEGYDSEVLRGVYNWFIINAMAGPLLPLPESIVKREAKDGTGERY